MAETRGLKKACQEYIVEICGTETVIPNYAGDDFGKFDLSLVAGVFTQPAIPKINTMFTSSSPFCAITAWDVVESDGAGGN